MKVGSAQLLRIKLNPTQTGKFSEQIQVYLSSNNQPIELVFKGVVKSIPKNNKTACPDFSGGQRAQMNYGLFKQQHEGERDQFFVEVLNEKPSNVVAENEIVEAIRDTSMEETRKPREKAERVRKLLKKGE